MQRPLGKRLDANAEVPRAAGREPALAPGRARATLKLADVVLHDKSCEELPRASRITSRSFADPFAKSFPLDEELEISLTCGRDISPGVLGRGNPAQG